MKPEFFIPFIVSNSIAVVLLILACWRPIITRWSFVAIFVWAAFVNGITSLAHPEVYRDYAPLALIAIYREFIRGFFWNHVAWFVFPIAVAQLAIAVLLTRNGIWMRLGTFGMCTFLLAIAPLGVGSAFPFSLIAIAAAVVMMRNIERASRPMIQPVDGSPDRPLLDDKDTTRKSGKPGVI